MTGWAIWSIGRYARNLNLTIWRNKTCTTQHLSWRITHKLPWDFDIQPDHLISARRPDLIIIDKKKRTRKIVDFAVLVDYRILLKENDMKYKYMNLAWEMKKLRNMKITIIPIMIGTFDTLTKGLFKGLEDLKMRGLVETIQTTALLRLARILRSVL